MYILFSDVLLFIYIGWFLLYLAFSVIHHNGITLGMLTYTYSIQTRCTILLRTTKCTLNKIHGTLAGCVGVGVYIYITTKTTRNAVLKHLSPLSLKHTSVAHAARWPTLKSQTYERSREKQTFSPLLRHFLYITLHYCIHTNYIILYIYIYI